jgi:hypothetical protein
MCATGRSWSRSASASGVRLTEGDSCGSPSAPRALDRRTAAPRPPEGDFGSASAPHLTEGTLGLSRLSHVVRDHPTCVKGAGSACCLFWATKRIGVFPFWDPRVVLAVSKARISLSRNPGGNGNLMRSQK